MWASDVAEATSDAQGKFTLRGFGPQPRFQLQVRKEGYVFINWGVFGREDGFRWRQIGGDATLHGPVANLNVTMTSVAWIEGRAVPRQSISGSVVCDGMPVKRGWVSVCRLQRAMNATNAFILRGRTVEGEAFVCTGAPWSQAAISEASSSNWRTERRRTGSP